MDIDYKIKRRMYCPSPIYVKVNGVRNFVPCGRCEFCLERKRQDWANRLKDELKFARSAFFITLTYDDKNLPLTEMTDDKEDIILLEKNDNVTQCSPTLWKKDVQKFMKRLRYYQKKSKYKWPVKYYLVGEYGTESYRPHYHALIFNINKYAISKLEGIWNKGYIMLGSVTEKSILYTTKYMLTKNHCPLGAMKPFSLASKKPAIGSEYLRCSKDWYKKNQVFTTKNNGYEQSMPRYYKDKIFNRVEKDLNNVLLSEKINKKLDKELNSISDELRIQRIENKRNKLIKSQNKKSKL